MNSKISAAASLVVIGVVIGGFLAACTAPSALLLEGDATSVTIGYSGGDLASATAIAARHCARYERVPRFQMADMDTAYYVCVRP